MAKAVTKSKSEAVPDTKPSKPDEVEAYMKKLKYPLYDLVEYLRKFILSIDKNIGEEIAWNAPSFYYTGKMKPFNPKEYKRFILNFNLFRKDNLRLIFLRGASVDDPGGLLEGDYKDGRRVASFTSIADAKTKEKHLKKIVQQLLKLMDK